MPARDPDDPSPGGSERGARHFEPPLNATELIDAAVSLLPDSSRMAIGGECPTITVYDLVNQKDALQLPVDETVFAVGLANDSISASIVEAVASHAIAFVCLPLNVNLRLPPFALHSIVWISLLAVPVPLLDV